MVVDFGGGAELALYVDGQRGDYPGPGTWTCAPGDVATDVGIAGNRNPWVVGASSMASQEGEASAQDQLAGAIYEFRFYDRRIHP